MSAPFSSEVELAPSRPNPASGPSRIAFRLPAPSAVELTVYDVTGKEVATLASGSFPSGEHAVMWDGRGRDGSRVATGTYFYRLKTDTASKVRKLVFLH
jgi:flagellar hook assembly protein FlgD